MKKGLYPRLAAINLRNNRRIYLPYLLTCVGTAMMFFIMLTLATDPVIELLAGGASLIVMLYLGTVIIGIFSVVLVLYANNFVIKLRKKEFGLYNILGMSKRNIGRILLWESLYTALISFVLAIGVGTVLSKLLQLVLSKFLRFDVRFGLNFSIFAAAVTVLFFLAIYLIALLRNLRVIHAAKPVELLRGTQEGEKEPKSKWILALLGMVCLVVGYGLAIMTRTAVSAIEMFFVAVIFVIAATYLLFTAFSIVFLKALKRNKKYYYKTSRFATVSGMIYRMKRNAGSLASICILSTMVLVTVSTTVCLYIGVDDALDNMYPAELAVEFENTSLEEVEFRDETLARVLSAVEESGREASDVRAYISLNLTAAADGGDFIPDGSEENIAAFEIITAEGYNAMTGENISLNSGEALAYTPNFTKNAFSGDRMSLYGVPYSVTWLPEIPLNSMARYNIGWEYYALVVADEQAVQELVDAQYNYRDYAFVPRFNITLELDGTADEKMQCADAVRAEIRNMNEEDGGRSGSLSSRSGNYREFLSTFGGLLFLGLFLGLLFLLSTVLIIYYKQVTEGYDDRERFSIMQKVGMTHAEVKKTIRSQVLTVFFLPLVTALIHIAFAFPMILKMLSLFSITNVALFVACTLITAGVFAALYLAIYTLTARTYYKIVA